MWIACGQERLADSAKIIAQTAARQGVDVLWEQYEAMPHTWAQIFPVWPQSRRCLESWAHACLTFVDAKERTFSRGTTVAAQAMAEEVVSVMALTPLTPSTALTLMEEKRRHFKPFIGAKVKHSL